MSKLGKFAAACAAVLCAVGAFGGAKFGAELKVSGYDGASTLENFPVLVKLAEYDESKGTGIEGFDYDDLANPETGADIWFSSDAAGDNVIPHEIDEWHKDGTSLVWVSLPTMTQGTSFYLHYKDAAPPEYTPSNVWLNANYAGVWHMNEPDGNVADATGHGLTAVPSGTCKADSIREDAGAIGGCRQNSKGKHGSGNDTTWLKVSNSKALNENGRATISCWFKFRTNTENTVSRVYSSKSGYSENSGFCGETPEDGGSITLRAGDGSGYKLTLSSYGNWNHMVVSYEGASMNAWHNGGAHSTSSTCSSIGSISTDIGLGCNRTGGEPSLNGWMDEYRLRSVASSADWAKAEYQTATSDAFVTASAVFDASMMVAVIGSPAAYGKPDPDYRSYIGIEVGQSLVYTAPEYVYLNAAQTERVRCMGWKRYDLDTGALVDETPADGEKTRCAFNFERSVKVVWVWQKQYRVTTDAVGGTVTASFWADEGSEVTIKQTAGNGSKFYGWNGDVELVCEDFRQQSLTFAATRPLTLQAMYTLAKPIAKTYVGEDKGAWDEPSNWDPTGVPTVAHDVVIPTDRRVIGGHKIFAHSVTLNGTAAISQGGHTDAYNESIVFTDNPTYGTDSNLGRYADSYTDERTYFNDILGDVTLNDSSQWIVGGHNSHPYKTFSVGGNFTQNGTSMVAIYAGKGDMKATPELGGAKLSVAGKATFASGTFLDAFCNFNVHATSADNDYATGAFVLLKFGSTEIAEGATIRSRLGVGKYTESALKEISSPPASGDWWIRGGAHGGAGGATSPTESGIPAYDYELAPILPGGCGSQARTAGGGVVRIDTGSLVLNGTVSASAVRGTPWHESGAPAGGAVWITCDTYAIGASAKISADGLAAKAFNSYNLGGGAGGRIAIATGLSDVQKTALARTGTTTDISSPSLLTDLYPSVVSVKGGTGARNGQPGGDGTAVVYKWVDPNMVSITVMTEPAGLSDAAFAPAVASATEMAKGGRFAATAPAVVMLEAGKRRLVSGWKAVAQDGTVVASGTGSACEIESVPSTINLIWQCETLQLRLGLSALGDGTLTGAEAGWREAGELTLTATPNAGATFKGWISGYFQTPAEAKSVELKIDFDRPMQIAAVFSGELPARTAKAYVGASGGSWDQDANWNPAGVPTVADDVTIPDNTAVAVGESAVAGSLTLGEGATVSVFGATTAFYESIAVNDNHSGSTFGRYAAERDGAPDVTPSVETVGDLTLGANAVLAVGGWRQRGQSFVRSYGDLTAGAGAKMSVYAGQATERVTFLDGTGRVQVDGTLALQAGALLDLVGYNPFIDTFTSLSCVTIVCGTFTVAEGAKVTANLPTGYNLSTLTSKGGGAGGGIVAGAGHGGRGGAGVNNGSQRGGAAYDSPYAPVYPGCSGRYDGAMNSIGGGVVRVTADAIRIDGELNVDAKIVGPYEYGGASGGSILLVCNGFSAGPNAKLSARGMTGSSYSTYVCGGGAGGRISICEGLSATKYAKMLHANSVEKPSGVVVYDQLADGAKYAAIVDVSGGKGRSGTDAEDGESGTAVLVKATGLVVTVK